MIRKTYFVILLMLFAFAGGEAYAQGIPGPFSGLPPTPTAGQKEYINDGIGGLTIGQAAAPGGATTTLVTWDPLDARWEVILEVGAGGPTPTPEIYLQALNVGYDGTLSGESCVSVKDCLDDLFASQGGGGGTGHPTGTACPAGQFATLIDGVTGEPTCVADDDVPEQGDFGNALGLDANGALSTNSVGVGQHQDFLGLSGAFTNPDVTVSTEGHIVAIANGPDVLTQAEADLFPWAKVVYPLLYDGDGSTIDVGPGAGGTRTNDIGLDGAAINVIGTLDMADRIAEAIAADCPRLAGGKILGNCILDIPRGTFAIDNTIRPWGSPADGVTNSGFWGMHLRGQGWGNVQNDGSTSCGTTFVWSGSAGASMAVIHAARFSKITDTCFVMDEDGDGGNVAAKGLVYTSENAVAEVSYANAIDNVMIDGFGLDRVTDNAYTTLALEVSPDGTGSSTTNAQNDNFIIRNSRIRAHNGMFFGQGNHGSVLVWNTTLLYADLGIHVEDSDFQMWGGYASTRVSNERYGGSPSAGEETAVVAMCDDMESLIKIGNTSIVAGEQPPAVSVRDYRAEIDCGSVLTTAQGASEVRDHSTIFSGVDIGWGDPNGKPAIDYRHDGTLIMSGSIGKRGPGLPAGPMAINIQPPNQLHYRIDLNHVDNPNIVTLNIDKSKAFPMGIADGVNRPLDLDLDGLADYIFIAGDLNGDGLVTSDDVQDGVLLLPDDSAKIVELAPGVYGNAALPAAQRALVSLPANTTLKCMKGARILGPDATVLAARTTNTYLVTNSAVIDPADLTLVGDSVADPGIEISGCDAQYDLTTYDTAAWTVAGLNSFGFYTERADGLLFEKNTADNTVHTCFYHRSGKNQIIRGNVGGSGCGSANDASATQPQNAFYLFASEGVDVDGVLVEGNISLGAGQDGFHTRGEATCQGGTSGANDNALCRLDGGTSGGAAACTLGGVCTPAKVRNSIFRGNLSRDAGNAGFQIVSAENVSITGNATEGGKEGIDIAGIADGLDDCEGANPSDDASCGNSVTNNTIDNVTQYGIRVRGGNRDTLISGNKIRNAPFSCFALQGPLAGITIHGNDAEDCSGSNGADGIDVLGGGSALTKLVVTSNTFRNIGNGFGSLMDVDQSLVNPRIWGNTIDSTGSFDCLDFDTIPTNATVGDNDCGGLPSLIPYSEAMTEALSGRSRIVTDGAPTADTGGATCDAGLDWIDTTATTAGGRKLCRNGSLVDLD